MPEIIYKYVDKVISSSTKYEELAKNGWTVGAPIPYIQKDIIRTHIKGGAMWKPKISHNCYTPVKVLNNYTHDWKIMARVLKKSKRSWNNMRGSGIVMTTDLVDSEGTQIQGVFFNDSALKFDEYIIEDHVYTMANGIVKSANKRFTSISNDFCIHFEMSSSIVEVKDDNSIMTQVFDFKNIDQICILEANKTIDFIGIVHSVSPLVTINLKNGVRKDKRTLSLADETGRTISMSFWGEQAAMSSYEENPVIAVKCVRVSNYGGKTLN